MNNENQNNNTLYNHANDDVHNIDEETLSRAILTFCLEGADAIMYTILLGAQHANEVVELLHSIVKGFLAQESANSAEQMQLPIVSEVAAQENIEDSDSTMSKRSKNQQAVATMRNYIKQHTALAKLENYFNKGLKTWGYKNNNIPQSLELLHTTIAKWCIRLTHLPTWEHNALREWFTSSGKQWIIAPHSKYWPKQLQELSFQSHFSPPLCLWGIGNPKALTQCHNPLAIVGSRSCTDYGRELAYSFARSCALKGHTVISGGAYGIDAAAHWGALDAKASADENQPIGKTIAVFAGGLNNMGPQSNYQLFEQIIANSGACISELCPDTTPVGHRFLLRNRIIAALSSKVIVAQARLQSGALNTASWATDLNRELYAIPGDITQPNNAGCNMLIRDSQAIMLCSQKDIDILFPQSHHYNSDPLPTYKNYTNLQQQIIKAISACKRNRKNASIDNIHEIIKSVYKNKNDETIPSIAEISGAVALLELDGIISRKNENLVLMQQKVA